MFDRVLNMSLELSVPNISNGRNLDKAEKLKTFPFLGCLRMREAGGGRGGGRSKKALFLKTVTHIPQLNLTLKNM